MSSTTTTSTAATSTIAPYRVHVITVIAPAGGFTHQQTGTLVDTFTSADGSTVITAQWGQNKLLGFTSTAGVSSTGTEAAKLQKLTRALGVQMTDTELWKSLPAGHAAKLGAMAALKAAAAALLVDIAPAADAAPAAAAPAASKASKPAASKAAGASKASRQAARDKAHMAELA